MKNKLFEKFLYYENEHRFFDIDYEGFKIWELMRTYIYIDIEQKYNNINSLFPQLIKKQNKKINLVQFMKILKIFFLKKQDYLFLNNPRRVKQRDGKYHCIYTDLLIDLLNDDYKCITFEDPYWALSPISIVSHFEPVKTHNICYLDFMEYYFKFKKIIYRKLYKKKSQKLHEKILEISNEIEVEFNCDLSKISGIVEDKILYVLLTYKRYKKIIKKIKPKAIFEFYDVFPSKIVINKIAKELSIPIIEIQHGIVTETNPIFLKYYDVKRKYECVPDYVLSYGKKLLNTKHMPIDNLNIYYIGNLFLEKKKEEYKHVKNNKKNILFISQSNVGEYISKYASDLSELLKNNKEYHIIYKMHPYEIGKDYKCLKKDNITIINNRDKDLYYFQSISIAQVGIYSTGLYEGLVFGLNTFIIDNQYGSEEIKPILKENESVYFINNVYEIISRLKNIPQNKKYKNDYWQTVNYKKIRKIIRSISKTNKKNNYPK